jgi:LPXTG-site transpeptidase (sortase) family protein
MIKKILRGTLMLSVFLMSVVSFFGVTEIKAQNLNKPIIKPTVQSVSELKTVSQLEPVSATSVVIDQSQATTVANDGSSTNADSAVQPAEVSNIPEQSVTVAEKIPEFTNIPNARLVIPKASVDAHIQNVGITSSGNLDVPPNFTDVGWYEYGPRPGQKGSVVLDGHVDNGASVKGVFKHLRDLKEGDDIYVNLDGTTYHYRVQRTQVFATNAFPGNMIFHENDASYLKIITCHGTYVPSMKTYDQRLIVTAVLI